MLSVEVLRVADEYWANDFGCAVEDLRPVKTRVQIHAGGMAEYHGASLLMLRVAPVVSVPEFIYSEVAARADSFTPANTRDPETLTSLLAPAQVSLVLGPAYIGYASAAELRQSSVEGTRKLESFEDPAVQGFKAALGPEDWDVGGIGPCEGRAIGAFSDAGELKAICGIRVWGGTIAHLCVATLPDARGYGFGTRAVAATAQFALELGLLPQYRTLESNLPSIRVAEKLGFKKYGWSMFARFVGETRA
jgi:GNAT superfamily N-acetyltransferase